MTELTPQETIDKFVNTHSEIYQDICKYSKQEHLPLTLWTLSHDFKSVKAYQLDNIDTTADPIGSAVPILKKEKPIAYVIGGMAVMIKRTMPTGKSTSGKINADCEELDDEITKDIKNITHKDIMNDPTKEWVLMIATSVLDVPNLEYGKPEVFKGEAIDTLSMYRITREGDDVNLEVETDSPKNRIGVNALVNVLGNKFGQGRK